MITLIIDLSGVGISSSQIVKNLTLKELGTVLTELSDGYILCFDTVTNINPATSCTLHISAVATR